MNEEKGNELIAEFLGWRFIKWCGESDQEKLPLWQRFDEKGEMTHPGIFHKPEFHKEWNSLMPVVEKIEAMSGVHVYIKYCTCEIFYFGFKKTNVDAPSKIEATWQAVVQFIQWLNKEQGAQASVATEAK
jgi:hypothetical protein